MLSILALRAGERHARGRRARGSDPHGWRNALNAYGWGREAMTDPAKRVYDDRAYRTFDGAVQAAVKAIARRSMPVGSPRLGRRSRPGDDGLRGHGRRSAASSNDFTVRSVYLSDPLHANGTVNRRLSMDKLRSGPLRDPVPGLPRDRQPVRRPVDGRARSGARSRAAAGRPSGTAAGCILLPIRDRAVGRRSGGEPTPPPTRPRPDPPDATPDPDATASAAAKADSVPPATDPPAPTPEPAPPNPDPTATPAPPDPTPEPTGDRRRPRPTRAAAPAEATPAAP